MEVSTNLNTLALTSPSLLRLYHSPSLAKHPFIFIQLSKGPSYLFSYQTTLHILIIVICANHKFTLTSINGGYVIIKIFIYWLVKQRFVFLLSLYVKITIISENKGPLIMTIFYYWVAKFSIRYVMKCIFTDSNLCSINNIKTSMHES